MILFYILNDYQFILLPLFPYLKGLQEYPNRLYIFNLINVTIFPLNIPLLTMFLILNCPLCILIFAIVFLHSKNLNFTIKLLVILIGKLLSQLRFLLQNRITLGPLFLCHPTRELLDVNGFFKSNTRLMVVQRGTSSACSQRLHSARRIELY